MEDFMAASQCLYAGEGLIQGGRAQRHRVCIVYDPGIGTDLLYCPCETEEERKRPAGPHDSSGSGGVTHALKDSVFLRKYQITVSALNVSRLDRYDHQVGTFKRLLKIILRNEPEPAFAVVDAEGLLAHRNVVHCGLMVNVMEDNGSMGHPVICQILEKLYCPEPASSADYAYSCFFQDTSSSMLLCKYTLRVIFFSFALFQYTVEMF